MPVYLYLNVPYPPNNFWFLNVTSKSYPLFRKLIRKFNLNMLQLFKKMLNIHYFLSEDKLNYIIPVFIFHYLHYALL